MDGLENPDRGANEHHRYIWQLESSRKWIALGAIVFAFIGFAINVAGVTHSLNTEEKIASTSPLVVLGIVFLSLAIALSERREKKIQVAPIAAICAILVSVLPHVFVMIGYVPLSLPHAMGEFGLATSLIIGLLALSVVFRFLSVIAGLVSGLAASAIILNGLVEQSYGLQYFDGKMSFITLVSLTFAMAAAASLYLHRPLVRVMFLSGPIGFRTRTLMAVGFLAPWLCGLLLYRWYGVPEREFYVEANLICAIIWIMLAVTLASGLSHENADKKRRAAERQLARQALTDPLTGLPNRAALMTHLAEDWDRFERSGDLSAIIIIDLDEFKKINDTFGHGVGDAVLRAVKCALLPCLRQGDMIGRWGGEEFICLIENTELLHLRQITERLRMALADISDIAALSHENASIKVSGSFGVSTFAPDDLGYDAAIKRADDALYIAKRDGRNRVVFDAGLRPEVTFNALSENALTA